MKKITIIINRKSYEAPKELMSPEDFRNLVGAPSDYEVWKVIHNPDPEGQPPKDDIQVIAPIEVKNGDRFRVVPPGTFGAA